MPLLEGKKVLIAGIANHRSIGWAIAQAFAREGAQLAFTYQERMEKYVKELAEKIPNTPTILCDVQSDEQIDSAFEKVGELFGGKLDTFIHSVAFAPPQELENPFHQTTRAGFQTALDISAYSLVAMARRAVPLMQANGGGNMLTLTYMASERVMPKYNVMAVAKAALECSVRYLAYDLGKKKIRVNAISAGPIKTLAARGISGLGDMLKAHAERAPLQRNVDVNEVGATGVFLASDASSGITGEVIYVDCGYNIMGF